MFDRDPAGEKSNNNPLSSAINSIIGWYRKLDLELHRKKVERDVNGAFDMVGMNQDAQALANEFIVFEENTNYDPDLVCTTVKAGLLSIGIRDREKIIETICSSEPVSINGQMTYLIPFNTYFPGFSSKETFKYTNQDDWQKLISLVREIDIKNPFGQKSLITTVISFIRNPFGNS